MEYISVSNAKKIISLWLIALLFIGGSIYFLFEIDKNRPATLTEADLRDMTVTEASIPLSFFEATDSSVTQPPTPTINVEKNEQTSNPNTLIGCQLHPNCGGGVIGLKRSECQNATCCQLGNQWLFYTNMQKCESDQEALKEQLQKQQQTPANAPILPTPLPQNSQTQNTNTTTSQTQATQSAQ